MLLQKTMLQRWCWSNVTKHDVAEAVLKRCCKKRCWSGVVENAPPNITNASVASKCTSTFFVSLFLFHSCSLANKMIMIVTLVFIFCCPYEIMVEDDDECNIRCHLLLFLWNQGKRQQQTCLIVVFFLFFLHCKRQWRASPLIIIFYNLRKKKT
jgi:hypothetical protein